MVKPATFLSSCDNTRFQEHLQEATILLVCRLSSSINFESLCRGLISRSGVVHSSSSQFFVDHAGNPLEYHIGINTSVVNSAKSSTGVVVQCSVTLCIDAQADQNCKHNARHFGTERPHSELTNRRIVRASRGDAAPSSNFSAGLSSS